MCRLHIADPTFSNRRLARVVVTLHVFVNLQTLLRHLILLHFSTFFLNTLLSLKLFDIYDEGIHAYSHRNSYSQLPLKRGRKRIHIVWTISAPRFTYTWLIVCRGRRGRDRLVVGFITTCAISAYHHYWCECESRSWRGVLDTTLCDKVCQWLAAYLWFSPGTPVSSTNKAHRHDITEILLKERKATGIIRIANIG